MTSSRTPPALAASEHAFAQWATAALVGIVSPDTKPSVIVKEEENLRRLRLPKALQTRLISVKNDNGEATKTKQFAEGLLTSFDGQFTSDTDDYDLIHSWRELVALRNNLDFVIGNQEPPPNEATSRCPVDFLLTMVMRMVAEKQNSKAIRYDHEVSTSMSKTYVSGIPFNISLNMICDGMASYRLPGSTLNAINKFALKHRIPMEVTSSGEHAAYSLYLSLCMLVVEYKKNNQRVALCQLLMDFAAILRHRRLLGFEQKHLLGITGCYTHISYYLTFYLSNLDDQGTVEYWNVGMLDIMKPAELLKAYVWIANSVTQFSDLAKVWQFDSNTPRDLKYLAWRAKANSSNEHGHAATGSSGLRGPDERSRKRPRSEGQASRPPSSERQQQAGGGDDCDGGGGDGVNVSGADDNVCMDEMDVSGSEAESEEFAASDERMENDRGRETAMIWNGSPTRSRITPHQN
ncbi:hypothetical protein EDD85DRAFT_856138 [Armillaria nabsnona]|nr:hypothetical protein EDD85DRAFT_856138 [Armillaria nabsnona]